jgi:hypothetical protein
MYETFIFLTSTSTLFTSIPRGTKMGWGGIAHQFSHYAVCFTSVLTGSGIINIREGCEWTCKISKNLKMRTACK